MPLHRTIPRGIVVLTHLPCMDFAPLSILVVWVRGVGGNRITALCLSKERTVVLAHGRARGEGGRDPPSPSRRGRARNEP